MSFRMFNQQEAQILIGGVNSPVDLDDLRKYTRYSGVYDDNEDTVTSFWNVSCVSFDMYTNSHFLTPRWSTRLIKNNAEHCCDLSRAAVDLRFCTCQISGSIS